jgi:hypothetical protein
MLSIAAGFLGGLLSQQLLSVGVAHAQMVIPAPSRPGKRPATTEVDAQRFVLVDSSGTVQGEFRMRGEKPEIVLYDKDGRVGWSATPNHGIRPVGGY